jgi:hypothetical protein
LLAWALSRVDIGAAWAIVRQVSAVPLAAAIAAIAATMVLGAVRWQLLLKLEGAQLSLATLLKIVLVGSFFNQMLPSGVGGDAVRVWRCREHGIGLGHAVRSILLDRVSGYVACLALYAVALPHLLRVTAEERDRGALAVLFAIAVSGLLGLLIVDYLPRNLIGLPVLRQVAALSRSARRVYTAPRSLAAILAFSAGGMILTVAFFWLLGRSAGSSLGFAAWLAIVPPVLLVQIIPVTIAGWGLREAALVSVSAGFGLPPEIALATSILCGLANLVMAVPGGLIWIARWGLGEAAPHGPHPSASDPIRRPAA